MFPEGHADAEANGFFAERLLKFLIWQRGGWLVLALLLIGLPLVAQSKTLIGFEDAHPQFELEQTFRKELSSADQESWARALSARAHHAGSKHGQTNIQYMAELFRAWGYDVEIETFDILLPVPVSRELELLAPERVNRLGSIESRGGRDGP